MSPTSSATELVDALADRVDGWRKVAVVGAPGSGKTTFASALGGRLAEEGPVVRVDSDVGQSTIGPPATVGAAREPLDAEGSGPLALRFVGGTTPSRHFVPLVTGVVRLVERGIREFGESATRVVLDDSGYYEGGGGAELHYQLIDAVRPDHLVALQRDDELERLLANFDRRDDVEVHRLPVPGEARERSREERRRYRRRRFARHFTDATDHTVRLEGLGLNGHVPDLSGPRAVSDLLVGLCDREGFLMVLGRLDAADPDAGTLDVHAPPFAPERLASVSFGSLRLEPEETGESGQADGG